MGTVMAPKWTAPRSARNHSGRFFDRMPTRSWTLIPSDMRARATVSTACRPSPKVIDRISAAGPFHLSQTMSGVDRTRSARTSGTDCLIDGVSARKSPPMASGADDKGFRRRARGGRASVRNDDVADADKAALEDLGAQSPPVDEGLADPRDAGERLHVVARLAEPDALQPRGPDAELPPNKVVEGDPAGHEVAADRARVHLEVQVAGGGLDGLRLDERDLSLGAALLRKGPAEGEVPVALESLADDRSNGIDRPRGRAALRGDVDRDDAAFGQRGRSIPFE